MSTIEPTVKARKVPRALALDVARELCAALKPCCEKLVVAGSLRREKVFVSDVELLYIPKFEERQVHGDMWATMRFNMADSVIAALESQGVIQRRKNSLGYETWGPLNKLALHVKSGVPVDFFSVTREDCPCRVVANNYNGANEKQTRSEPDSVQAELRCVSKILREPKPASVLQVVQCPASMGRTENQEARAQLPHDDMPGLQKEICKQDLLAGPKSVLEGVRQDTSGSRDVGKQCLEETRELLPHTEAQAGLHHGVFPGKVCGGEEAALRITASDSDGKASREKTAPGGNCSPSQWDKGRQPDRESANDASQDAHGKSGLPPLSERIPNQIICPICNGTGWHCPNWWNSLVIRTGSLEMNLELTKGAIKLGRSLQAYGSGVIENGHVIPAHSEQEVFDLCGVGFRLPKDR